jgi:hypothetical protein
VATVGSLAWSLIANNQFGTGTRAAIRDTRMLRGELVSLKGVTSSLTTVMGGLGVAIGGAALLGGLKSMVSESMEAIEATGNLSDRLGVATERLSGLQHAAQLNGSSAEELNTALDTVSKTIGVLNERGGRNVKVLAGMGVDIKALAALSPDEMFLEIADAMKTLGSAQERAALAGILKLGPEMVNVLMEGRDALEANVREAEALGIAYSRVDAEAVKKANDAWDQAKASIKGVANEITISLAPAVEVYAAALHDAINAGKIIRGEQGFGDLFDQQQRKALVGVPAEKRRLQLLQEMVNKGKLTQEQAQAAGLQARPPTAEEKTRDAAKEAAALKKEIDSENKMREDADRKEREELARADAKRLKDQMDLADSIKTPAQRFIDEFSRITDVLGPEGFVNPALFRQAMEDLQSRVGAQVRTDGPAGAQSTAAIRAGSIDALRAQFSGNIPQKQLKEAEKQTKEQESMRGLLEDIRDKLNPLAEAPG